MAKQSLAAKQAETAVAPVESNPGAGLPVGFTHSPGAISVPDSTFQSTAYVQFMSMKGQGFAKVAAFVPDLSDGDPCLILPEPARPIKLSPFRFYLVQAFGHQSVVDSNGTILQSTTDAEKAKLPPSKGGRWAEHIETVLLVIVGDSIYPARCTFKTTKVRAARAAVDAYAQAATPAWPAISPEHKATLNVPQPWARFTTFVTLKAGTGKASGYGYVAANGRVIPTTLADWQLLSKFFESADNRKTCEAVIDRFNHRRQQIKSMEV